MSIPIQLNIIRLSTAAKVKCKVPLLRHKSNHFQIIQDIRSDHLDPQVQSLITIVNLLITKIILTTVAWETLVTVIGKQLLTALVRTVNDLYEVTL